MLLLWNQRVLVPYFKEMNALFETDGNVRSLPAVAGLGPPLAPHCDIRERRAAVAPAELFGFQGLRSHHQEALLGLAWIISGQRRGHGAAPGVAQG